MDETSADTTHDLLLALAGQVDDDLLSWARELVAVDEARHALELLTASLVAERVELPGPTRAALVAAGRSVRTELDADAALPPDRQAGDTPHRFDGGPADQVGDALRALPARLLVDCQVSLARRLTPAGSASGPLPHPVVLVQVAAGARNRDVLAYQLADALDRAGVRASVEVLTTGSELPGYHAEALRRAQPVRTGERGDSGRTNGSGNGPADAARPGIAASTPFPASTPSAADRAAADDPLGTGPRVATPSPPDSSTASPSTGSPSAASSSAAFSSAREQASSEHPGPQRSTAPPRPVPVRPTGGAALNLPPAPSDPSDDRDRRDVPELSEQEMPAPRPEPRRLPDPAPRPVAQVGTSHINPTPTGARPSPSQASPSQAGPSRPGSARSGSVQAGGPTPYREGAAASNVRSIVVPGGSAGEQRPDEPRSHPERDEPPAPVELPRRSPEPAPTPVGEELTQLVPPRHRYLIERSDADDVADPGADRPAAPAPTGASTTEPLTVRSTVERDRGRPLDPEDELAALSPHELLRPESVARLSASGRELLARLQAEMQGGGPTFGPRAGGLTANGGGNGHNGGGHQGGPNSGNGTGPHSRVDPPDLAG